MTVPRMHSPAKTDAPQWRIWGSRVLLVLFGLSTVLSMIAIWEHNQIESTDRYVRTVAPLASDPAIQNALLNRVSTQVSTAINDILARDTVSDRDRLLAAPLASLVEQYVNETVHAYLTSDQFPATWEAIIRTAHPIVTTVLTGGGTESISTANGQITLDLAPLINEILNRLQARGMDIVSRINVANFDTSFVVFESQSLADSQNVVRILSDLAYWLPLIALVFFIAALVISVDRRTTLMWAGLGLSAWMAFFLVFLAVARWWIGDHLPPSVNKDAAIALFETLGRYLRDAARYISLIGLAVAALVHITRPGGWIRQERTSLSHSIRRSVRATRQRMPALDGAGPWANQHLVSLAILVLVAGCLLVVIRDPLTAQRAVLIAILLALGFGSLFIIRTRLGPVVAAPVGLPTPTPQVSSPGSLGNGRVAAADARAELMDVASELSAEDVRVLRRVATALRDSR